MRQIVRVLAVAALSAVSAAGADVYEIDPAHSQIGFRVKHLGISNVPGRFRGFSGTVTLDKPESTAAKVEARIDAASVDTGVEKRDEHLRGPEFFDAVRFPAITFASTRVSKMKGGKFVMEGELTMKGVTRPVKLDVTFGGSLTDPWGKTRGAFTAVTRIDRKDFGVSYNKVLDNGGLMISDKVDITLEIEATKKEPAK